MRCPSGRGTWLSSGGYGEPQLILLAEMLGSVWIQASVAACVCNISNRKLGRRIESLRLGWTIQRDTVSKNTTKDTNHNNKKLPFEKNAVQSTEVSTDRPEAKAGAGLLGTADERVLASFQITYTASVGKTQGKKRNR